LNWGQHHSAKQPRRLHLSQHRYNPRERWGERERECKQGSERPPGKENSGEDFENEAEEEIQRY